MTFCEAINYLTTSQKISSRYFAMGVHTIGVAPTPVPPMAGLLDGFFASPSYFGPSERYQENVPSIAVFKQG
jgi:hypothetical protein